MELDEKAEEILESLWIYTEEASEDAVSLAGLGADKETVDKLTGAGYIRLAGEKTTLTDLGKPFARNVVRRHRLAERLLADVLGAGDSLMHDRACKFEHIIDLGLDESICSLLGHPRICPHGKPIPPGRCCTQNQRPGQRVVSPLSQLTPGQKGKVAYIYSKEPDQLQKLTAMGILPGAPLDLIQIFPSYLFQIRQTQFAVDREIADIIYIRLVEEIPSGEEPGENSSNRKRQRRGITQRLGLR